MLQQPLTYYCQCDELPDHRHGNSIWLARAVQLGDGSRQNLLRLGYTLPWPLFGKCSSDEQSLVLIRSTACHLNIYALYIDQYRKAQTRLSMRSNSLALCQDPPGTRNILYAELSASHAIIAKNYKMATFAVVFSIK